MSRIEYKNLSVLIVDDIFNMRVMLKKMLLQMGFRDVMEAGSGEEALAALSRNLVDLVLCDWNMPGIKGIDVLKFIRKRHKENSLPFVMITGELNEDIVAEAAECEVDAYIVKPLNMKQLSAKIHNALVGRRELSAIDKHLEDGKAYVTTKQYANASKAFKAALAINPQSPRTLLAIGNLYEEQGNDITAREYYERSLKVQPRFLKGHEALANVYRAIGDSSNCIKHLDAAIKISPRNLERRFMLGQVQWEAGNTDEAKKILGDILEEAINQFSSLAEKVGETLLKLEAYDVAERAFSKAIEANPNNLRLFNQLGIAFRRQGKFEEAISNYLRAVKIAPQDENLHYNLARAYLEYKQTAQAVESLEKALAINPNFKEARNLLEKARV